MWFEAEALTDVQVYALNDPLVSSRLNMPPASGAVRRCRTHQYLSVGLTPSTNLFLARPSLWYLTIVALVPAELERQTKSVWTLRGEHNDMPQNKLLAFRFVGRAIGQSIVRSATSAPNLNRGHISGTHHFTDESSKVNPISVTSVSRFVSIRTHLSL